jgi:hypothetical protein
MAIRPKERDGAPKRPPSPDTSHERKRDTAQPDREIADGGGHGERGGQREENRRDNPQGIPPASPPHQ